MNNTTRTWMLISLAIIAGSHLWAETPDYGNSYDTATALPADGTTLTGELTANDQDWFTFVPDGFASYRVRFSNQNSNWKTIRLFQENEFGDLVEFYYYSTYAQAELRTLFLEYTRPCYVKVEGQGGYSVMLEYLETIAPDLHSNECGQGDSLTIDAPAVRATLDHTNPEQFDTDWFVIDTEPFHMYQVTLSHPDNCWAAFRVHPENCGNAILWNEKNSTLTSWYGEQYQINVVGDESRLGCQYNLQVVDLGPVTDDHGNTFDLATEITTDSSDVFGTINYNSNQQSDVDWFKFEVPGNGLYQIDFSNPDSNWKTITVYQIDTFGNLARTIYWSAYSDTVRKTFFLEKAMPCYLQVSGATGDYAFTADEQALLTDDTFGDTCAEAAALTVDAEPTTGTLNHVDADTFDTDWFSFQTEALHMYRVILTHPDNGWARFRVYPSDCGNSIAWDNTDYTITSWDGEEYRLNVVGDSNRLGNTYTIQVIDLGPFPDDFGNRYADSSPLPLDGSELQGRIDYNSSYQSDQDWFHFEATGNMKMSIHFNNGEANWKTIHIYQVNPFGDLVQTISWACYGILESHTIFLEQAGPYAVQVDGGGGDYSLIVDGVETVANDSHGDSCDAPTAIVPGNPVDGTLEHKPGGVDQDWFVLHTQALHSYHLQLSQLDNCSIRFRVYKADCATNVEWDSTDITLTSWSGEDYLVAVVAINEKQGQHYTLNVTDLGAYPDDYPNTAAASSPMPKDGTLVEGVIDYETTLGTDEDWFRFVAGREGDYQFQLHNPVSNWKNLRVYRENEFGQLVHIQVIAVYGGDKTATWQLSEGQYYIQVHGGSGAYGISLLSPEPRCGDLDHPYPPGDASRDCIVDLTDLAIMATHWMEDANPTGQD